MLFWYLGAKNIIKFNYELQHKIDANYFIMDAWYSYINVQKKQLVFQYFASFVCLSKLL